MELYIFLSVMSIFQDENKKSHLKSEIFEFLKTHYENKVKQKFPGFYIDSNGRPYIKNTNNDIYVDFNISHSKNTHAVIFALGSTTNNVNVGCDIEFINKKRNYLGISRDFFYESEFSLLKKCSNDILPRVFYSLWTAKESYLKTFGLSIFDISKTPEFHFKKENNDYPYEYKQFCLENTFGEQYLLTVHVPKMSHFSFSIPVGWRFSKIEQIYAAVSPAKTVIPKT